MSHKRPALTLVPDAGIPASGPDIGLSSYRSTVVELPWRDRLGRIVLISIDARGRIYDQRVAENAYAAELVTNHMIDDLYEAPTLTVS